MCCEQKHVDRRVAVEPLDDVEPPGGLHGSVDAQEGDPAARVAERSSFEQSVQKLIKNLPAKYLMLLAQAISHGGNNLAVKRVSVYMRLCHALCSSHMDVLDMLSLDTLQ